MRTVYSSAGADVTAAMKAYLQANSTLIVADLYTIGMFDPWNAAATTFSYYCYTSASFSITVGTLQFGPNNLRTINKTWIPAVIERGQLEYSVGLSVSSAEVTWFPDDLQDIPGNARYTWKEAALSGFLDSATLWIHRAWFPADTTNHPGTILGTSLMWAGMIQEVEAKREYIKLTVPSLLQPFHDVLVPTQTVQAGIRTPPYVPSGPFITVSGLQSSSTPMDIQFSSTGSIPNHEARDTFLSAYVPGSSPLTVPPGTPRPIGARVRDNVTIGGITHFYLYEPVNPVALPNVMTLFFVEDIGGSATAGALGFPVVPPPEASI